jgi:D-beta-D-heptose 7-phosphate kinase/D-beta-D-heptose 1-phosphate adenosyltransferase
LDPAVPQVPAGNAGHVRLELKEEGRLVKRALIRTFREMRILVVGDIVQDRYLIGTCDRISQEAPVPVVRLKKQQAELGGAANVAANLAALKVSVTLGGVVGDDPAGNSLLSACEAANISTRGILTVGTRRTTVKSRVLVADQQIVRIDEEDTASISDLEADAIFDAVCPVIKTHLPHAVIISDYAKGVCTPYLCQRLIAYFREIGIPVFIDPKGQDFEKYRGARAITPNRVEMTEASKANGWPTDDLVLSARMLLDKLDLEFVALTLGAEGMSVVSPSGIHQIPTVAKEVFDVSGAGDTVIATMVAGLAAGLDRKDSLSLATIAAGVVVGHVGSRPIKRDELILEVQSHSRGDQGRKSFELQDLLPVVELWKSQGLSVGFTNGCFDLLHAGHVQLLEDAASRVDRLIVAVNSDESITRLKGPKRPLMPESQRVTVLSALEVVDAVVVFTEDTPLNLIEAILPTVLIKGGDYKREEVIGGDAVEAAGGRVELVPLVPGISTSYLAQAIEKL